MPIVDIRLRIIAATIVGLCGMVCGQVGAAAPADLSPTEADGYRLWLHSLEKTTEARQEHGLPEGNVLFPWDQPPRNLDNPRPYRHLSISKAVTELEAQWNNRGNGNLHSALMALANARNYVNLSEYDSALVWYRAAADMDSSGSFRHEIAQEGLACAISARDSLAIAVMTTNTLGTVSLKGRQDELVLVYRWLLTARDGESLEFLTQKLASHPEIFQPRLRFWHAYALNWLGRTEESLDHLRVLLGTGGLSHNLTEKQRAWVLRGAADAFFLLDSDGEARRLYSILADSSVLELKLWGKYQTAGLDLIEFSYLKAGNGFQEVCEGHRFGAWQDQACILADIAKTLQQTKTKGEPYGVANYYQR